MTKLTLDTVEEGWGEDRNGENMLGLCWSQIRMELMGGKL